MWATNHPKGTQGAIARGTLPGAIIKKSSSRGATFLGGNCLGGNYLWGNNLAGNCPGCSYPRGNFPWEQCVDTRSSNWVVLWKKLKAWNSLTYECIKTTSARWTIRKHALFWNKTEYQHSIEIFVKNIFDPFHDTDLFLYSLRSIKKPEVSWYFQGAKIINFNKSNFQARYGMLKEKLQSKN